MCRNESAWFTALCCKVIEQLNLWTFYTLLGKPLAIQIIIIRSLVVSAGLPITAVRAVDTIGILKIIISIKPYLVTSNGEVDSINQCEKRLPLK